MSDFVNYLNSMTKSFILKGDSALRLCYGLTRLTEDIELDALRTEDTIVNIVSGFCMRTGCKYRVARNTKTEKVYMIYCGGNKPLKVTVSYARQIILNKEITEVNGVVTYTVPVLLSYKLDALEESNRLVDLYDIVFICRNYWDLLTGDLRRNVSNNIFSDVDFVNDFVTQNDGSLDINGFVDDFLYVYDSLR